MEDKEYTALNYEGKLKEYIEKKRQDFYAIIKKKGLHDLIQRFELSGYQDHKILEQIALHKVAAAEIIEEVLYYLYLIERNSRVFAKTSDDLAGSETLKKITGSQLFKNNSQTLSLLTLQVEQFEVLFSEYKKFEESKDFDSFMFLIEKATNFTEEERLEAYREVAKQSCVIRRKEINKEARNTTNKSNTVEKVVEIKPTENNSVDILRKVFDFVQRNARFIEKDDDQTVKRRKSLSPLVEHLNTPDCDAYSLEEKIGILMYAMKESAVLYEAYLTKKDEDGAKLYYQDVLEKLEIGEEIVRQIEEKESKENLLPNVIFLKDNREEPLIYYDIEDYTVPDKLRLFQKIKELQDPGIDKSSGKVKMDTKDSHVIYYKESGGVGILYTRLPNNVVLIIATSKDSSGIYKIGQTRDESYFSKIDGLISMATIDKAQLLETEKAVTDEIANELTGIEKEREVR